MNVQILKVSLYFISPCPWVVILREIEVYSSRSRLHFRSCLNPVSESVSLSKFFELTLHNSLQMLLNFPIKQVASEAVPVSERRLSFWRRTESGGDFKIFLIQDEPFDLLFDDLVFLSCSFPESLSNFPLILRCLLFYSNLIFKLFVDSFWDQFCNWIHVRTLFAEARLLGGRFIVLGPVNWMKFESFFFSNWDSGWHEIQWGFWRLPQFDFALWSDCMTEIKSFWIYGHLEVLLSTWIRLHTWAMMIFMIKKDALSF